MDRFKNLIAVLIVIVLALLNSYLIVSAQYNGSTLRMFLLPGLFVGIVVFIRPIWGVFLVLLLSPLKTFGSEILLLARFLGLITVVITLVRSIIYQKKIRWTGIESPIILMFLGMAISFFRTADYSGIAFTLLSLISLYGLVLVIINLVETEAQLKQISLFVIASGIIPIFQALMEGYQGPTVDTTYTRVSGTFSLPTGLGGFLIMHSIISLALVFYPGFSRRIRLAIFLLFGGGVIANFFSLSRSALLGVAIGFFLVIYFINKQQKGKQNRFVMIAMSAVFVFAIWSFWPAVQGRILEPIFDIVQTRSTISDNLTARTDEIQILMRVAADYYLLGTGIGNYGQAAVKYRVLLNMPALPTVPHNIFLYFIGEAGIFAGLGFIWLLNFLYQEMTKNQKTLMACSPGFLFYFYIGSLGSLIGYIVFLLTHSGLFTNELWLATAFFLLTIQFAKRRQQMERQSVQEGDSVLVEGIM